jgi:hypothetical protein
MIKSQTVPPQIADRCAMIPTWGRAKDVTSSGMIGEFIRFPRYVDRM